MKVLHINCVYPGGSTGKIIRDLGASLVRDGHESIVAYGRGQKPCEMGVYKTCTEAEAHLTHLAARLCGIRYGGAPFATRKLFALIKKEKPDVVHLHSINGYFVNIYRLLDHLKRKGIPTVLTLHAEFMFTANCSHAYDCMGFTGGCGNCPRRYEATESYLFDRTASSFSRMKRATHGFSKLTAVAVSPWGRDRAALSPIFDGTRLVTVKNGLDTLCFTPDPDVEAIRAHYAPNGEKLLLHVTAEFSDAEGHSKGGAYILSLAKALARENVRILVAGDYDERIVPPSNLLFLGRVTDQKKLAGLYSAADLCILSGRRETYSMPVAESLSCGTPVVGFLAGGPESIALPAYSRFVHYGDTDALCLACREMLAHSFDRKAIANEARIAYDKEEMYRAYLAIYQEATKGVTT